MIDGEPVPCQGCTDRKIGYHVICDKYKKFKEEVAKMNIIKRAQTPMKIEFQNNKKRRNYEHQKNKL